MALEAPAIPQIACYPTPVWFFLGCGVESVAIPYPQMVLSTTEHDFGEVAAGSESTTTFTVRNDGYTLYEGTYLGFDMGLRGDEEEGPLVLGPDDEVFCAWWIESEVSCSGPRRQPKSDDSGIPRDSYGEPIYDSGGGGRPDPDTGTPARCEDNGGPLVLGPGCSVPVHVSFAPSDAGVFDAAVWLRSDAAPNSGDEIPEYTRDPRNFVQQVFLHGEVAAETTAEGILGVTPSGHDFGQHVPDGLSDTLEATFTNSGTREVVIGTIDLHYSCDGVSVASSLAPGESLAPGASGTLVITFTPVAYEPMSCVVTVTGDDDHTSLYLHANQAVPSDPPSVSFVSPGLAAVVDPLADVTIELALGDDLVPPSSLDCELWSLAQGTRLADCNPADDSGTTTVILPPGTLDAGPDTLVARVGDGLPPVVTASLPLSVLVVPALDGDADAYDPTGTPADCDDADAATYPGAVELPDAIDNDCDGTIDEGTAIVDDDGDGYTPEGGDCDDTDPDTSPAGIERADSADNDCDGRIDDETSLYDDDGDGWTEVDNDCHDADPSLNPSAAERCNGVDDDCDGAGDVTAVCGEDEDPEPEFIGAIEVSPDACEVGETVEYVARVRDLDQFESAESDGGACSSIEFDGESLRYQCACPAVGRCIAENYAQYLVAADEEGGQAWNYAVVTANGPGTDLDADYVIEAHGPCAPRDGTEGTCGLALGLAILAWRRHRRHPGPDKPAR